MNNIKDMLTKNHTICGNNISNMNVIASFMNKTISDVKAKHGASYKLIDESLKVNPNYLYSC